MIMTQARPPPKTAISHEEIQAKIINAVLWYQSRQIHEESVNVHVHMEIPILLARERTSIEAVRESPFQPSGMIEKTLCVDCAATPSEFGSPTGARIRSFVRARIHAGMELVAIGICGDVQYTGLTNVRQDFVGSSAVVDIGDDCSALRTSASLEFGGNSLRNGSKGVLVSRSFNMHQNILVATVDGGAASVYFKETKATTYSLGLSSFLLWSSIRVESEGRNTSVLGFFNHSSLRVISRNHALWVLGCLNGALLLELALFQRRHVAGYRRKAKMAKN